MAKLELSSPPELGPGAKYPAYRGWLAENFHLDICSYCLLQYRNSLSIDHYVPRELDPARVDDPSNLLLSCQSCGRKKWDYHPHHAQRRCRRHDTTGFMVLDVRNDDLARFFIVDDDGRLAPRPKLDEHEKKRAAWNVALLRLDLRTQQRGRLLDKLRLVQQLRALSTGDRTKREQQTLDILEQELSEHLPTLRAFDLPLADDLRQRLEALVRQAREP